VPNAEVANRHSGSPALHARMLESVAAHHQGRVFKVTDDGALLEFGSAVNAVQCASSSSRDGSGTLA
jgi:class 3 adenylate cyclase